MSLLVPSCTSISMAWLSDMPETAAPPIPEDKNGVEEGTNDVVGSGDWLGTKDTTGEAATVEGLWALLLPLPGSLCPKKVLGGAAEGRAAKVPLL